MSEANRTPTDPNSSRMVILTLAAVLAAFWGVYDQHQDAQELLQAQIASMKAQREDARDLLQAQIAAELDKEFDSTEMRKARRAFARELQRHPGQLPNEDRVLSFFEKVGNYLSLRRIDDETTYNAFSYYAERYWAAAKTGIMSFRTTEGDKGYFGAFEDLNNRMLHEDSKDQHRPVTTTAPSGQEVKRFLGEEASLNP